MNRESILKAVAAALQPDSLDLTQFAKARAPSLEREFRVRADEAAGALAYAALDQYLDAAGNAVASNDAAGVLHPGDALAPLLLRLKYADQASRDLFARAHRLLMSRCGERQASDTLDAVGMVALFEWVNDSCPTCRGKRHGVKVSLCTGCRPSAETLRRSAFRTDDAGAAIFSPAPGCPKCKGMGRIFQESKAGKGMKCLSCHSTGRKNLIPKRRAAMVSEFLFGMRAKRGDKKPIGLHAQAFQTGGWGRIYYGFLDVLRSVDNAMVQHVDLKTRARARSSVQSGMEEQGGLTSATE